MHEVDDQAVTARPLSGSFFHRALPSERKFLNHQAECNGREADTGRNGARQEARYVIVRARPLSPQQDPPERRRIENGRAQ